MLDVIDGYTKDELEAIGDDARATTRRREGQADKALATFEADLAACR